MVLSVDIHVCQKTKHHDYLYKLVGCIYLSSQMKQRVEPSVPFEKRVLKVAGTKVAIKARRTKESGLPSAHIRLPKDLVDPEANDAAQLVPVCQSEIMQDLDAKQEQLNKTLYHQYAKSMAQRTMMKNIREKRRFGKRHF